MARWIIAAGLLGTLMASPSGAAAEWFFRGTANGWAATAMVSTDGVNYDTCQSFQGGDASGGPRFKIDRYGNWQQSYPAADKLVNANTHYQIRINAGTQVITTTAVDSCTVSGFAKTLPQLQVRGTFNGWASLPMTLVGDHLWQAEAYMDGKASQRLKFDQAGDWATNFGDSNADGVLERSGGDIFWGGTGTVRFQVNDQTLAYSITPFGDDNQPPLAVITPGGTVRVAVGDALTLSGSDSTDPDGQVAGYLWSNGEITESIVINTSQAGTFTYGLTVTDDQGAKASSSVSVVVAEPQAGDKWYFRGTPNNWGLTAMTSQDGVTFCTEQAFGSGDPRFKVDHKGDWTEAYPAQDYKVTANTSYRICFDSQRKALDVAPLAGADTQAPTASASPAPGNYAQAQSITLSVSDDKDSAPRLYFTLDGSTPSTGSALYSGQTISASDKGSGADLVIKTLGVDAAGNRREQSFSYYIGDQTVASGDFRAESIYFLLTARFYDGDAGNNYYNRDRYKAGDPQWRGDFKGLIGKLDYIKDLGFTAIWVTPPVENRSGLDYHGYHAYDFYRVDPRLESPGAGYREFIQAAHAKGIKVIQDVVINHSSQYGLRGKTWIDRLPIKYYVPTGSKQGLINNGPYQGNLGDYASANRCDDDNPAAPDWYKARCQSDPEGVVPLVDPKTGSTVPSAGYNPNRFFGIDAQTLDPAWYHLDGFMSGGDWENPQSLQRKHMAGDCIDLATGNQNVKDYINGAIHQYLDMGVDAIRIDTLKHIERDELLTYVHDWQAHKPGLFVFGENLVKGTGWGSEIANDNASAVIRPWWYTRTTSDPANPRAGGDSGLSVLDFSLFSTFRDNVTKGSFGGVGGIFGMDWVYGDATKLITFFQNHDVGPDNDFKYRYGGEEGNAAMTYNLLWTARGIPTLYYGEEVMFQAGKPQDIDGATMTVDQTGRAYYGDVLDNPATPSHPLYQHLKRLNQIRKAVPALQKAPMSQVNEWGSGISFVRDLGAEGSYAAVGLAANSAQQITMSGVRNGSYTDAVTGTTVSVSNGSLSFQVPAYSARIWVLGGPGKVGADGKYLK